ncbi:hypothetical protein NPIL_431871 [Nephila pilipes]|uniref:Uncharacterized protein n=1 Tax=Nephila pilipes TaxID=299642 RepID=A0A8X6TP94_NEPPI|nr:hypothetical protein NPIL_431871 [Nephila pilipes]
MLLLLNGYIIIPNLHPINRSIRSTRIEMFSYRPNPRDVEKEGFRSLISHFPLLYYTFYCILSPAVQVCRPLSSTIDLFFRAVFLSYPAIPCRKGFWKRALGSVVFPVWIEGKDIYRLENKVDFFSSCLLLSHLIGRRMVAICTFEGIG